MLLRVENFNLNEIVDEWTDAELEEWKEWRNDPWNDPECVEGYLAYCWACDQAEMEMRGIEK